MLSGNNHQLSKKRKKSQEDDSDYEGPILEKKETHFDDIFGDDSNDSDDDDNLNGNEQQQQQQQQRRLQLEEEGSLLSSNSYSLSLVGGEADSSDEWGPDFIGNDEDRRHLESLTEMERESILYERAQVRQRRLEKQELRRRLQQKDAQVRQSASAGKRAEQIKSLLERKAAKKGGASMKKSSDGEALENEREKLQKRWLENESSMMEEAGSLDELELKDVNDIFLSRTMIEKHLYRSFFPEFVKGLFVRIYIGKNDQGPVYRMALVDDLVNYTRSYKFGSINTDKALQVRYVKSVRNFKFDAFSNTPIQAGEFSRWRTEMKHSKVRIYGKSEALSLAKKMQLLMEMPVTEDEVNQILEQKQKSRRGCVERNFTMERLDILNEIEVARSDGNKAALESLNESLNNLDAEILEQKKLRQSDDRLNALAEVNKRNRLQNISEIREAELKLRAQKRSSSGVGQQVLDPFARRKCRPDSYFDFSRLTPDIKSNDNGITKDDVETFIDVSGGVNSMEKTVETGSNGSSSIFVASNGIPIQEKQLQGKEDLFAAHNFDLEIDL